MSSTEIAASHPITVGTIAKTLVDSATVSAATAMKMDSGAASERATFYQQ